MLSKTLPTLHVTLRALDPDASTGFKNGQNGRYEFGLNLKPVSARTCRRRTVKAPETRSAA